MSCNVWGSSAPAVPREARLGNTLSKFHRMCTVLQTVELCLIYLKKKKKKMQTMQQEESTMSIQSFLL